MRVTLFVIALCYLPLPAAGQPPRTPQGRAALTGHVTDQTGRPIPEVFVTLLRRRPETGDRLRPIDVRLFHSTDRNGAYKLDGLAPGEYFVVAIPRAQPRPPARMGFGTTYYPGASSASDAKPVVVKEDDPTAADIRLNSVLLGKVYGTVVLADGTTPDEGRVLLGHGDGLFGLAGEQVPIQRGGRFEIAQLPPGTYFFQVREGTWPPPPSELSPKISGATVVMDGKDQLDVKVLPIQRARVSGKLIVHSPAGVAPVDIGSIRVATVPRDLDGNPGPARPATIKPDLTFELLAWPGAGSVRVFVAGREMRPVTVRLNGVDVTEKGIDFAAGTTINGVEVEFTLPPR